MPRTTPTLLLLLLAPGLPGAADDRDATDKPLTPADQYKALLKEYQSASSSGRVLTDAERLQFVGSVYRLRFKLSLQFVELAEKHPEDPIAVDALLQAIWQVNGTPWPVDLVGKDEAGPRALALLERDHIRSDKLGPACERLSYGFRKEYESFLRAVLANNPHADVQGQARLALAHFLGNRLERLRLIEEQPPLAREFEGLFGKEYSDALRRQDPNKASAEEEALLEETVKKYGEVKLPSGGTVGEKATSELFEIRHLTPGKEAPDIEGEDQDGKRFKLSDYRGKVVLLDFWSEY